VKKADYSKIAAFYDSGRVLSEQNINILLKSISRLTKAPEGARLLDLGCGTGRFSIPIATKLHYQVTGADSSEEMLIKARAKDVNGLVKWDIENAQNLTYPANSFDIVFMSHLLHHCEDPPGVIRECWRVLSRYGMIIIRWGAIEQIRNDVEHTFFTETIAIDEVRTYTTEQMEGCLREAGFSGIISEEIVQQTYRTGKELIAAAMSKGTSVLTLISDTAFEQGIRKLKDYTAKNPDDPWLRYDRITITTGYKSKEQ
jgi:ubiquinone/menaquinone biosynthesis C-methylase UbiE